MNKLLLIGLISVLMAGCGESNKITNDYVVGDWECNTIHYESNWKDGGFSPYIEKSNSGVRKMSYKKDGAHYYISENDGKWRYLDFESMYKNETSKNENDIGSSIETRSISMKNDNTFILLDQFEYVLKDKAFSDMNKKSKDEVICTRIK